MAGRVDIDLTIGFLDPAQHFFGRTGAPTGHLKNFEDSGALRRLVHAGAAKDVIRDNSALAIGRPSQWDDGRFAGDGIGYSTISPAA